VPNTQAILNAAVGVLYDRYVRLVYSVAIRVAGDPESAEEITQDVFVRACEGASTYHPETARVSSWLVGIARHRAIDELRRRSVRPESAQVYWPEEDTEGIAGLPLQDNLEQAVDSNLRRASIRRLIAALPPDQQQVLGLAFFQGLSHSQIAEFLGEPLGTVKSRARLAIQKLRDALVERGLQDS